MTNNIKIVIFCSSAFFLIFGTIATGIFVSQRECKTHPPFAEIEFGSTKDGCKISEITVRRNYHSCSLDTFKVVKCPNNTPSSMVVGQMVCNGRGSCVKDQDVVTVE